MKVGFAGSGNMAAALARGWRAHGGPEEMLFSDAGSGRAAALAGELGGTAVELARGAGRGQRDDRSRGQAEGAGGRRRRASAASRARSSRCSAQPLSQSSSEAFPEASVLRTMPNVAVEIGRGVICHARAERCGRPARRRWRCSGGSPTLVELPEAQLDAATAVMGCSPAPIWRSPARPWPSAGAGAGLDAGLSDRLVRLTAAGTGELLLQPRLRRPCSARSRRPAAAPRPAWRRSPSTAPARPSPPRSMPRSSGWRGRR